jgi:hypothetical protein
MKGSRTRTKLERAVVRDQDIDREISADWFERCILIEMLRFNKRFELQ